MCYDSKSEEIIIFWAIILTFTEKLFKSQWFWDLGDILINCIQQILISNIKWNIQDEVYRI